MPKNTSATDRIIFPLDVPSLDEAVRLSAILKDSVGVFKIGLELFVASGPTVVQVVKKTSGGRPIFLDLKFHDIPATVKAAVRSAAALGVDFVTVHCDEGRAMLQAVVEGSSGRAKILGVTVLTSLGKDELAEAGIDERYRDSRELVLHRARVARVAGCAGVVCSGLEASAVKEEFGKDFLVVTPGIRSAKDDKGDQKRTVTAYEAVLNGADYIVVGRPIRNAPEPKKAALEVASEVARALRDRAAKA